MAAPQYIAADDDDDDVLSFVKPTPGLAAATSSSSVPATSSSSSGPSYANPSAPQVPSGVSGRIGSNPAPSRSNIAGVRVETRYTGMNTLDEPVSETILRDLKSIYAKLLQVLYPPRTNGIGSQLDLLRDWDLWGPLVICLALAIMLSLDAPAAQSIEAFSMVISLVTIGSVVVTVNAKLLGGKVSFFQSLCVLGYCVAPLLLASIVSFFLHSLIIRLPVSLGCMAWSVWASVNFLSGTRLPASKQAMAVYPLFLFYFMLAWMILIQ
ncbi:Uncharacterized conserved protein [Phaffia rhodozyma]|uniref:Protein YIP n=1 Tax=Phaffia rhodozyma TaxID=264483 RepID=A0A0F7SPI1_PHARH|nr:Uncharacterized conserved protein [Phaffia rhodozyma]